MMPCQEEFKKHQSVWNDNKYRFDCILSNVHTLVFREEADNHPLLIQREVRRACHFRCRVKDRCPHCNKILEDK